jgi:hypothetical protein
MFPIVIVEFHKLINSIWNKEELPDLLLYQFTRRVIKLNVVIFGGYNCYQQHMTFYPLFFSQS